MALYQYGLYVNSVAGEIKKHDMRAITEPYNALPIKSRNEIEISTKKITDLLKKAPGKYLQDIYDDIEREILYRRLNNDEKDICSYILNKYGKE